MSSRVRELFHEALERSAGERPAFLRESCGDDEELLRDVTSLLDAHESLDGFLGPDSAGRAIADAVDEAADPLVGRVVGGYRLVRLIARGGMGAVYLADQDRPRRRVALKLIDRSIASPELIRRFEIETQALGRLQHPGIARILEAGTADTGYGPRPFFAMEYIEGLPLGEHARRGELDLRARIGLMVKLCEAAQHAHQNGVIHRDLKPSNILVDGTGEPRVLDFGVARGIDGDLQTETASGSIVGTLAYMSPEQVRGRPEEIDTRTDVYALGVVCYELVCGRLPRDLEGASVAESIRLILEQPPRPIRAVARSLPADLETILATALEDDPERRYASASELAADLRRLLGNQPIAARPPSTVYQLRKLMGRHRLPFGLAAALVVAVVALLVITTVQARRIAAERDRANEEAEVATRVSSFLEGLFRSPNPGESLGEAVTAREILDRGLERIDDELADQPVVRGRLLGVMGRTYHDLGQLEVAGPLLEESVALARASRETEPLRLSEALRALAWYYSETGRAVDAVRAAREALEVDEAALGADDPRLATGVTYLATELREVGELVEARRHFERALAINEAALGPDHLDVGWTLYHYGWLLHRIEESDEARRAYERAGEIMERELAPAHPQVAWCLSDHAKVLSTDGDIDAALGMVERALAIREQSLPADHPHLADSHSSLGFLEWQRGDFEAARGHYRDALAIRESGLGAGHPLTLESMANVSRTEARLGRPDEAGLLLRDTVDLARTHHGDRDPQVAVQLQALASFLVGRGRHAEAAGCLREAVGIYEEANGVDSRRAVGVRYSLATLLADDPESWTECSDLFLGVLAARERNPEWTFPALARVRFHVGRLQVLLDRPREAESLLDRARLEQEAEAPDSIILGETLWWLGHARFLQGDREEARPLHERALGVLGRHRGEGSPQQLLARAGFEATYGSDDEALDLLRRAVEAGLDPSRRVSPLIEARRAEPAFGAVLGD